MRIFSLFILLFMFSTFAQDGSEQWREIIAQARSPQTNWYVKEKVAQGALNYLRKEMADEYHGKDVKEIYQDIIKDPKKLDSLLKQNSKYKDLFTDLSVYMNQMSVERAIKDCEEYKNIKVGVQEGNASYNPCREGTFSHTYMLWKSEKPGQVEATVNEIPSFLYSDNVNDILAVSNNYHVGYGAAGEPPLVADIQKIQEANQSFDTENLMKTHAMMRLQNDAYQRAVLNAARNVVATAYQYSDHQLSQNEIDAKITSTINSACVHCSEDTKRKLRIRLAVVTKKDIAEKKIESKSPFEVAENICAMARAHGYTEYDNISRHEMTPLGLMAGKARAKMKVGHEHRMKALSKVAQAGGDGLLVLTESMTNLDEKQPAKLKLHCSGSMSQHDAGIVLAASKEAQENALKYITKLNEKMNGSTNASDIDEHIKFMMRTNPRAIGEGLNQNTQFAQYLCSEIGKIKDDDELSELTDTAIIWGAGIVGGALSLTGVLAPAGAALTMGALALGTAIGVGTGVYEYMNAQDALEKAELYQAAVFASKDSRLMEISQEQYAKYQSAKVSAMVEFGFSAFDILASMKNFLKAGKTFEEAVELIHPRNAHQYFDNLSGPKAQTFAEFKAATNFDQLPVEKQEKILDAMFDTHINNNTPEQFYAKKRDLVEVRNIMKENGIAPDVVDKQVVKLADDNVLGLREFRDKIKARFSRNTSAVEPTPQVEVKATAPEPKPVVQDLPAVQNRPQIIVENKTPVATNSASKEAPVIQHNPSPAQTPSKNGMSRAERKAQYEREKAGMTDEPQPEVQKQKQKEQKNTAQEEKAEWQKYTKKTGNGTEEFTEEMTPALRDSMETALTLRKYSREEYEAILKSAGGEERLYKEFHEMMEHSQAADYAKHMKAHSIEEAKKLSETGNKFAQYNPGTDRKALEKNALVTMKGYYKTFSEGGKKTTLYKFVKFEKAIGFDGGKETKWLRVEWSSDIYHGHPINPERLHIQCPECAL